MPAIPITRGQLEGEVVVHDEARRDPGARARERELSERELSRVAGHDDEREHDDRRRRGGRRGLDAVRRKAEADDRDAERGERERERGTHTSAADFGRSFRCLAAEGEGTPSHHEHDDDDDERHGPAPSLQRRGVGHLRLQERDLALEHADEQTARERQPVRPERADQRRRHARHDQQREVRDVEPADVHDEDRSDDGEAASEPPVRAGDDVGRDAEHRGHAPVLGHRARRHAEAGAPRQERERDGQHDRDPEQDQAIDAEVDAGEDGDGADREDVRDDARVVTPDLESERDAGR